MLRPLSLYILFAIMLFKQVTVIFCHAICLSVKKIARKYVNRVYPFLEVYHWTAALLSTNIENLVTVSEYLNVL